VEAVSDLAGFYVHTVTVTPLLGSGAYGDVEGPPQTVAGFLDSTTRLVRSGSGEEVVSQATLYTDVAHTDAFPPGSTVTLPDGRATTVIGRAAHTSGALDLPDHLEITLS
jgi:hypothetical protein